LRSLVTIELQVRLNISGALAKAAGDNANFIGM
jgi:hypothetical protein